MPWRFCIAPMIDWSDRHCRFLWRLLSKRARLYTEMVTTGALLHGNIPKHLQFNPAEKPLALQLGGSDPAALARCAKLAEEWQYDEINFNCGCPSDRVQAGKIGAILMGEPQRVAECVAAMQSACSLPVTVKHRIGIDHMDDYEDMANFVDTVAQAGCETFIVHARKAWLKGLSPKENRDVPPLNYESIFRLKKQNPQLRIVINGGVTDLGQCETLFQHVDGIMMGREAYHNPWRLYEVDSRLFNAPLAPRSRMDIAYKMADYIEAELSKGTRLHHITRHTLGLFNGLPGARKFRRHLSEYGTQANADVDVFLKALNCLG